MDALGLDEVWWLVSPGNPLKEGAKDMAPFEARFASAEAMARRCADPVSDFEREAGTRYTVDTVAEIEAAVSRRPVHLADGKRHCCRIPPVEELARACRESLPIAVIHRPGYDSAAHAARAMGWLKGFVRPSSQARQWTEWSAPAILFLRLPPDPTSATGLRAHDPNWHERFRRTPPRVPNVSERQL